MPTIKVRQKRIKDNQLKLNKLTTMMGLTSRNQTINMDKGSTKKIAIIRFIKCLHPKYNFLKKILIISINHRKETQSISDITLHKM